MSDYMQMTAEQAVEQYKNLSYNQRLEAAMLDWDDEEGEYVKDSPTIIVTAAQISQSTQNIRHLSGQMIQIVDKTAIFTGRKESIYPGPNAVFTCDPRDMIQTRIINF